MTDPPISEATVSNSTFNSSIPQKQSTVNCKFPKGDKNKADQMLARKGIQSSERSSNIGLAKNSITQKVLCVK